MQKMIGCRRRKRHLGKCLLVSALLLTALVLVLYPFISNYVYEHSANGIIKTVERAAETDNETHDAEIAAAQEYNRALLDSHVRLTDPFIEDELDGDAEEYDALLNMTDAGVMGFITIPCIDVSLPIYHGTSESTLEKGAGHLQGTSLPVGGEGTHSVITGHTGLSKAKMFTDLTELDEGDIFFLEVMGLELAYAVDDISIVEPADISNLTIEPGLDLCTLVTCTPYGINSHRLLVRGRRTDYEEAVTDPNVYEKKETESQWMVEYTKSIVIGAVCFIILLMTLIIYRQVNVMQRRKRRKSKRQVRTSKNVKAVVKIEQSNKL